MRSETRLDFAIFQLDEARTRCELWVTSGSETEKLAAGSLKPFLTHLHEAQKQLLQGRSSIRLQVPSVATNGRSFSSSWFTKGTTERFVRFVTTPDVLERVSIVESERRQLEEAIGILSAGEHQARQLNGGMGTEEYPDEDTAGDSSKNQLLVAMDARRIMLQKEQTNAFSRAAAAGFDMGCMADLMDFADCFGASRLREACLKFASIYNKMQGKGQIVDGKTTPAEASTVEEGPQKHSRTRRTWGGQDKAAMDQLHQNTVESTSRNEDTSTNVSESTAAPSPQKLESPITKTRDFGTILDSPPGFDSPSPSSVGTISQQGTPSSAGRMPRRSASPRRRSCSPMRKVQIGRSGSRRPSMVVIRNINYATASVPEAGKNNDMTEGTDSAEENASDTETKEENKEENKEERHRRLSVQDAISLFEQRQRESLEAQAAKTDTRRESGKSVLRRWSSIGDNSNGTSSETVSSKNNDKAKAVSSTKLSVDEPSKPAEDVLTAEDTASISKAADERRKSWLATSMELERTFQQLKLQEAALPVRSRENAGQKASSFRSSLERSRDSMVSKSWSATTHQDLLSFAQQAEVEMKDKQETTVSRGADFYEQYREIRDAKIRQESGSKRAERESKMKSMQAALEKRKAELVVGARSHTGSQERPSPSKAPTRKGGTTKPQQTRTSSRTNPAVAQQAAVATPRPSRHQLTPEQKSAVARKLSPGSQKSSSVISPVSRINLSPKLSTPVATQRRAVDNPLARSMPALSELRKENTRPVATRSAAPQSKIPAARNLQQRSGGTSTRHRSVSKVMPLEPNGVVTFDSEDRTARKTLKSAPVEDDETLTPLKPVRDIQVVQTLNTTSLPMQTQIPTYQDSKAFLRKGRGTGAGAAGGVLMKMKAEVIEEDEDPSGNASTPEAEPPLAAAVPSSETDERGSIKESQDMDLDVDDESTTSSAASNQQLLVATEAPLLPAVLEQTTKSSSELLLLQVEPEDKLEICGTNPVVADGRWASSTTATTARPEKGDDAACDEITTGASGSKLTLMQQLAGDEFVDSSQVGFAYVPWKDRRASMPALTTAASPLSSPAAAAAAAAAGGVVTGSSHLRHSLSPEVAFKTEVSRKRWGRAKPIQLAQQSQQQQQQQHHQHQQQQLLLQQHCKETAPKGLKRLLKFGRKSSSSRGSSEWVSASTTSEGEDTDESSGSSYFRRHNNDGNGASNKPSFFSLSTFRSKANESNKSSK